MLCFAFEVIEVLFDNSYVHLYIKYVLYIYIPLLKINKINFITMLSLNFLQIGQVATG